jgi:RNA polymerase sigma-70 factor, ECF subfamily
MPGHSRIGPLVAGWATNDGAAADADADADLVAAARRDPAAFAALYRRYVDRVYRYCHHRLGNREAAEDATSRVFVRAFEAFPRYRDGSFRAWLFTIAHHTIANDLRRGTRIDRPIDAAAEVIDPAPGPEDVAVAADARTTIQALLAMLSDEERRLLELRLAGLSGPEIAHVLGRSHGAVKVAQFRAIARLRAALGADDAPGRERDAPA